MIYNLINLLITFGSIGLLLAFSPLLITTSVIVAIRSKNPIYNILAIALGAATPFICLFLIASTSFGATLHFDIKSINKTFTTTPIIQFIVAIMLIGVGIVYKYPKNSIHHTKEPHATPKELYIFSSIRSLFSATNIFAALLAAEVIRNDEYSSIADILLVVWIVLIGLLPFIVLLGLVIFRRNDLSKLENNLKRLDNKDYKRMLANILIIIGLILIASLLLNTFHTNK